MPDNRSGPLRSVLINGTVPNYKPAVPDTSQTNIAPCLLVYLTASGAANGVTLAGATHGDAIATERSIGIVEILKSRANCADDYDTSTPFAPIGTVGSNLVVHWLRIGDQIWVKGNNITATIDEPLICAANGLVAKVAGTSTVDAHVHTFRPIYGCSGATYIQVEYLGQTGVDNSS